MEQIGTVRQDAAPTQQAATTHTPENNTGKIDQTATSIQRLSLQEDQSPIIQKTIRIFNEAL